MFLFLFTVHCAVRGEGPDGPDDGGKWCPGVWWGPKGEKRH